MVIDHIVHTCGINFQNDIFETTLLMTEKTFRTNTFSLIWILKILFHKFSNKVSVVAIASQNGVVAHEKRIDYGPSKSALIHLVKNLTIDFSILTDKDIKINSISPSYIINDDNADYLSSIEGKKLLKKIPYKKFVNVNDVVHAIEFLLHPNSDAIRGHNLVIDYGYTII